MTTTEELAELDAIWDELSSGVQERVSAQQLPEETPPESKGTFGHDSERRLGLRVPAAFWALVKVGERSVYARTVELSPTGAVLKLLDANETRIARARRCELDIFVPGSTRPLHAVAWPVRAIGQLEAFEFLTMSSVDRLTLAEHLDQILAAKPTSNPPPAKPDAAAPPVSWKNFVLSLKRPQANGVPPVRSL